ncbi:biogenesis of lysosome-related organelles complex 1 subunit 6-like protein, partial [Dinothrombium tinctorium]
MNVDELNKYQSSVITSIEQESLKIEEKIKHFDLEAMVNKANVYYNKLLNIKKEMDSIAERSEKLKKRALRLQEEKQIEALEYESMKDKQLQLEKHLLPVKPSQ